MNENYMDFVGVLVAVKKNLFKSSMNLTLTSGEGTVQVNAGRDTAERLKIGDIYTIGYVKNSLIKIRPGICETAR